MATERILIIVDEKGSVVVKKRIQDVGTAAENTGLKVDKTRNAISGLGTAFAGLAGLFGTSELIRLADAFTNLQNRMSIVTNSQAELQTAMQATYEIAQSTYTAWEGIGTIYARTAQASTQLGLSQSQLIAFTNQLAQATALSGSSAEAANNALVQLSQGMAEGTLRGDELVSVLSQLPYVSNVIADGMGVAVGSLRQLASEGAITPQVIISAFNKMSTSIQNDFNKFTPTISMGLQTIENGFIKLMGTIQNGTGVFSSFGLVLTVIGNNMEVVALAMAPLAAGLAALAVRAVLLAGAQGFGLLITSLAALTRGLVATSAAAAGLLLNPVTLWVTGITVAVTALIYVIAGLTMGFDELDKKIVAFGETAKQKISEVSAAAMGAAMNTEALKNALNGLKAGGGAGSPLKLDGTQASQQIKKASADGAKAMGDGVANGGKSAAYSQKTALELANENGANKLKQGVGSGGDAAAAKIAAAGQVMAAKFEGTGRNIYDLWNNWGNDFVDSFGTTLGTLLVQFQQAQTDLLNAQAQLAKQQAEQVRLENKYLERGKALPGQGGGGGSGSGSSGGSSTSGGVTMSNPWDRGTKKETSDNSSSKTYATKEEAIKDVTDKRPLTIINRMEPNSLLGAMASRAGDDVIFNSIAADPDKFRKALGVGG